MKKQVPQLILTYTLATYIRWWFITSDYRDEIQGRIEVTTPLNSMKRIIEGKHRESINVDPYSSDVLHEPPVLLKFYSYLIDNLYEHLPYLFILLDVITAHLLYLFVERCMLQLFIKQEKEKHAYSPGSRNLIGKDLWIPPVYAAVVFLFNPYTILNCVAMSTTALGNLLLSVFLVGLVHDEIVVAVVALALSTAQSFYPIILLSPLCIRVYNLGKSRRYPVLVAGLFFAVLMVLLYCSKCIYGDWSYLEHTVGFILGVPDQQPNVGIFWYFFMEMFEHFRTLFIHSFQLNVTLLYLIPLSMKYRNDPALLSATFLTLIATFKSYPSIGDFSLTFALLPCWKHLYHCTQQVFVSYATIIVTTALAPVIWDLWIYWGAANANFFFGATLFFITAHVFVVTDISFAHTKREYLLKYGTCRTINGKQAKLVLDPQ